MKKTVYQTKYGPVAVTEITPIPSKQRGKKVVLKAEMDERMMLRMVVVESRIHDFLMAGIRKNKDFQLTIDFRVEGGAAVKCIGCDGTRYGECHWKKETVKAVAELQSKAMNFIMAHARIGQNPRFVMEYKPGLKETSVQFISAKSCNLEEP